MPEWWDGPAREQRLRMIGIDRPGYGNAPADPNRSLRSVAEATAALADDLGVDQFAVIGMSGGGPYALACGAFLPDRVVAVISGAGSSGFDEALDGRAMDPDELKLTREQALRPTAEGRAALARFYDPEVENLRSADVDGFMSATGSDPAAATPEQRATIAYVLEAIHDGLAMLRPWGFELAHLRQPVAVWHSEDDSMVAFEHGRRLVAAIPHAEPFLVDGSGTGASAAVGRCRCSTGS